MSNERDHEFVRNALPECAQSFLSSLPALRTREAIVVGEGVPVPMRVRFDELAQAFRPHSDSASFSDAWRQPDAVTDGSLLVETIRRWRAQGRLSAAQASDPGAAIRSVIDSRARPAAADSRLHRYDPNR